jgi:hypothetical protein
MLFVFSCYLMVRARGTDWLQGCKGLRTFLHVVMKNEIPAPLTGAYVDHKPTLVTILTGLWAERSENQCLIFR